MSRKPKVSVLCLAYNQEKYIAQAIEGFLMQKTDFDFEILLHDDCSTDGTKEIIKDYAKKYPAVIKPVFQKTNQYSQGKRNFFARFLIPKAEGEYIALCEGDDFWTDSQKLQAQADFLDAHPGHALCFHPVRVFFENNEEAESVYPAQTHGFTVAELLRHNFIQTNSVMYRRQKRYDMALEVTPADWYLHLYHAQFGKIGYLPKVMAAYRRHENSMWWDTYKDSDSIWRRHGLMHLRLYREMLGMYGGTPKYRTIINVAIDATLQILMGIGQKYGDELFRLAMSEMPEYVEAFAVRQSSTLQLQERLLQKNAEELESTRLALQQKDVVIAQRDQDLRMIKNSKFWRLRNVMAKLLGKEIV